MFFSFSQASLNIFPETHKATRHRKFQLCMVFLWLFLFLAVMTNILFWVTGVCGVSFGGGAKTTEIDTLETVGNVDLEPLHITTRVDNDYHRSPTETMEMMTITTTLASVFVIGGSVTQVSSVTGKSVAQVGSIFPQSSFLS